MKQTRMIKKTVAVLSLLLGLASCSKKDQQSVDTTYPEINLLAADAFPRQCSEIQRGQAFTATLHVSDNKELGSLSIDIHHNFDQHSHSTEIASCNMDAIKSPVKPMVLIQTIPIPAGQTSHKATYTIQVPADIDPGDYHFLIRITDKEGWQTIKGLSIKIK